MRSMAELPSGWLQKHVLLYKNPLVLAQLEIGKRAKSIYYEVYGTTDTNKAARFEIEYPSRKYFVCFDYKICFVRQKADRQINTY